MNIDGVWLAIGWLIIASSFLWWIWTRSEPEIPNGVTLIHSGPLAWDYHLDDSRGMMSTGYLTRAAAIRAANHELNRLNQKDTAQ